MQSSALQTSARGSSAMRPANRRPAGQGAAVARTPVRSARSSVCVAAPPPRRALLPRPPRAAANAAAAPDTEPETVFYESAGAPSQLAFQILLGASIIYLPLTIAAVGRYAWTKVRITNRRLEIVNTSPLFKSTQQLAWSQVKEVRSAPRAFGLWGDVVLFLKGAGGGTVELTGIDDHVPVVEYIKARVEEARKRELERKLQDAGAQAGGGALEAAAAAAAADAAAE